MKLKVMISLGLLLVANGLYAQLATFQDSVAYAYGNMIGNDLRNKGIGLNPDMVAKGISEGGTAKVLFDEAKAKELLGRYQQEMMAKMQAEQAAAGAKNLEASNKFMEENKKKPGVVVLPSGVQYEVVKAGDPKGVSPTLADQVTVNYEGSLINGKVFDSSYERNEPITFELGGVIQGWQEGLQKMKPGDVFMLYIPSNLGYGERGAGESIGPNEALIFKVELISVQSKAAVEEPATAKPEEPAKSAKPAKTVKPAKATKPAAK